MILPGSDTYFLGVSAHVSLKVASDVLLVIKKRWKFRFLGCFSKEKGEDATKKPEIFLINLEGSSLAQTHIFWE